RRPRCAGEVVEIWVDNVPADGLRLIRDAADVTLHVVGGEDSGDTVGIDMKHSALEVRADQARLPSAAIRGYHRRSVGVPEGLADGREIEFGVLVLQVAAGIEVGAAEAQGLLVDRAARLGVWNERMVTRSDEELHPGRAVPLRLLYRVVHVGVVNRRGNLLQLN